MKIHRTPRDEKYFTKRMIKTHGGRLRSCVPEPKSLDPQTGDEIIFPFVYGLEGAGYFDRVKTPNPEVVMEFLRPAAYWSTACWALARDNATPVTVSYRGKPLTIQSTKYGNQGSWAESWGLAWTLRHTPLINALLACGAGVPNRGPGPLILIHYTAALAHFHQRSEFWIPAANARMWQSDPSILPEDERIAYQDIRGVANLILAFEEPENTDRFNQALYDAILAHKQKLIDTGFQDHNDRQFAWVPMGLACVAHDLGIPIQVESEYAPGWLVRGEFDPTYHPPGTSS